MLLTTIFLVSLLIVTIAIPQIITLAFRKRLFDVPSEERKVHKRIVPGFGGVAIFTSFLFCCSLFIKPHLLPQANMLMAAGLILFMTGLKDDIIGLGPAFKFVTQFANAIIVAVMADIRIHNLEGLFGIGELNYYVSIGVTVMFIVGIVNAYNLIDGIDGLAGSLGVMVSLIYSFMFLEAGEMGWAYLSTALTGSLIGFLFYNVTPAKIFMGDSGSLVLGFIAAVLSIKFINITTADHVVFGTINMTSSLALVLAILIIPIFDTLRVFTLRILGGRSPFAADSNHLHHRLLFLGLSHIQSALILTVVNCFCILLVLVCQSLGNTTLVISLAIVMLGLNGGLTLYIKRYKKSLFVYVDKPNADGKSFSEEVLDLIRKN